MTGVQPRFARPEPPGQSGDRGGSSGPGRRLALVAFLIAVATQLVVVYAPTSPGGPTVDGLDKVIHLAVFAAPTLAALLAGLPWRWVVALFLAHAPLSELVQARLVASRESSVLDAVADITGVLVGVVVFVAGRRRQRW